MLEIYRKCDPLITKDKMKQTQIKEKQFSCRGRRKPIHDPYISTKWL